MRARAPLAAWSRFWFEPQPTSTLALVRMAIGVVALLWALSLGPDLLDFFGDDGAVPAAPDVDWWFGVLGGRPGDGLVVGLWVALVAGSAATVVGWHTRLATAVTFAGLLSLQHRNPYVLNSGDLLLRHATLFLALSPAGASLSLDRRRRHPDRVWEIPARSPWALRLLQVQVSVVYLATLWSKSGDTWRDGTALSYAFRLDDLTRFPVPDAVLGSLVAVNLLTYATVAAELAIGVLVWNRRARPWVLAAGVLLHVGIELTIMVGFFSLTMVAAYVAFVPPEVASRWVLRRAGARVRGVDVTTAP